MQKKDDKVGNKTANKEERQRKKREPERKIEKDLTKNNKKNNNWLVRMREKQKSCFKNYVLLVGKDFFFLFSFFLFFIIFFLHKHYYIGAKLILAILMLISRKPVQIGEIGEKCVFFVLLRTGHRKRVRLPNVGSCCVSLHVAFR